MTMRIRATVAMAALALAPIGLTASTASAAPTAQTAAAARLGQCDGLKVQKFRGGWQVTTPGIWEDPGVVCNLKYGDLPHRPGQPVFGDPASAIKTLQRNLNSCYKAGLKVDGRYGSATQAAVRKVQAKHRITADGIYGPKTRSAINWRLYNPAKKLWNKTCTSPI